MIFSTLVFWSDSCCNDKFFTNWFTWNYIILLVIQYPHYCFIGSKENDEEWDSVSSYEEAAVFLVVTAGGVEVLISNITMWSIYIRKIEGGGRVSDFVRMWTHVDVGMEWGVQFTLR